MSTLSMCRIVSHKPTRMTAMDDLTSRFLDAFATIEKHLRRMLDANKYTTFNEMVERAVSRDRSVRRLWDQLKTLGELRNFLVHEYKSDQPLAVPSESTVQRIQIIRDELLSPVKLVDLFRPPVEICSPSDPIDSTSVSSLRRARILWNSLRHLGRLMDVARALFQIAPVSCDRTIITGQMPR